MRRIHFLSCAGVICLILPQIALAQSAPANGNSTKVVRAVLVLNHSLQDRDKDGVFRSELLDLSVKLSYTFRF